MGKKKTASKSQATFVDEESSLSLIENQEFVAMRAAQKVWPAPTTSEDQLRELVSDGLIQSKVIAEWRVPASIRFQLRVLVRLSFSFLLSTPDFAFLLSLSFISFLVISGLV